MALNRALAQNALLRQILSLADKKIHKIVSETCFRAK